MRVTIMMVRCRLGMTVIALDADHVDRPESHPALGYNLICQGIDRRRWPAQQHGFKR